MFSFGDRNAAIVEAERQYLANWAPSMILKLAIPYALVLMFISHAAAQDNEQREPVPMTVGPQSSLYSVDGLALGAKVAFGSAAYRQYRCVRSEKFEGFVWCTKTSNNTEARGPFKVWFSMLHAQNGVPVYVNQYQQPAYWGQMKFPKTYNAIRRRSGSSHTSFSCRPAQGLPEALSPHGERSFWSP